MKKFLKKYWFMLGLIAFPVLAVIDISGFTVRAGIWLKAHHGPDLIITLIFFLSGLALDMRRIRAGVADYTGTLLALFIIFVVAPVIGLLFSLAPLADGVRIGLLLVAVMPTTLSSGVVMTGSAGGNMAHALLITILANVLAVFTIPVVLAHLLGLGGENRLIEIEQLPIMIKIAKMVLLPLALGMTTRTLAYPWVRSVLPHTAFINSIGILLVVWMAGCQGRTAIVTSLSMVVPIVLLVTFYHLSLVAAGLATTRLCRIGKGRRESIILMGGQKTLPLSIILQVSLFPEFGLALVFCVLHHITHLALDGFLVRKLQEKP